MKNFRKFFNSAFWRLTHELRVFKGPVVRLHRRVCDSLASETSSRKKHLEIFQKSGFLTFWRLIFATPSRVEVQVESLLRGVCDSLASGSPNCEKDLEKFFKILFKGFWRLSRESVELRKMCVLHK